MTDKFETGGSEIFSSIPSTSFMGLSEWIASLPSGAVIEKLNDDGMLHCKQTNEFYFSPSDSVII